MKSEYVVVVPQIPANKQMGKDEKLSYNPGADGGK